MFMPHGGGVKETEEKGLICKQERDIGESGLTI